MVIGERLDTIPGVVGGVRLYKAGAKRGPTLAALAQRATGALAPVVVLCFGVTGRGQGRNSVMTTTSCPSPASSQRISVLTEIFVTDTKIHVAVNWLCESPR